MAASNAKTSADRLQAAQRRRQCVELRLAGATFDVIAERTGLSKSTVHKHITKALADITAETRGPAESVKAMELARLDRLLVGVWGNAAKGDVLHVDRVLKIMERRAKLLGLDAPTKLAHGGDPDAPPIKTESAQTMSDADLERIAAGSST